MWKTRLLLCLLLIVSSGCEMTGRVTNPVAGGPAIVDNGCNWTRPIFIDKTDKLSQGTVDQILAHNMTGQRLCGWQPSKKN